MSLPLNEAEQQAADSILKAMRDIKLLYGDEFPYNWSNEGVPAIHTLQMFVLLHWGHRVSEGEHWSDWSKPKESAVPL